MESETAASRKGSNAFSDFLGSMKTHPALGRAGRMVWDLPDGTDEIIAGQPEYRDQKLCGQRLTALQRFRNTPTRSGGPGQLGGGSSVG